MPQARWNTDPVTKDYAQTNNPNNTLARLGDTNKPFLDFYVTMIHLGDNPQKDIYLPGAIKVRVTKPILSNNAGGAGYFNPQIEEGVADDGFVSMEEIAAGFIDTLKRSNFNVGTNTGNTVTSTGFTLEKIVASVDRDLSGGPTAWAADSKSILKHHGPAHIGTFIAANPTANTLVNSRKTIVVDGTLYIDGNISASDSVAFIAKEIQISGNVTRLDGIYIANKITGTAGSSQLIVNGSLYGNAT